MNPMLTYSTLASTPNPAPEWLVDRAWKELCRLSKLPSFKVRQHTE